MLQQLDQLKCSIQIDYSEMKAERVLPFLIELDLFDSIIDPGPGEYQRFCYNISGIGFDVPAYAHLDYLVLGICRDIQEDQIKNISVVIDGDEQFIQYGKGGNVELLKPDKSDTSHGPAGLKFDFDLDKVAGEMSISYELTRTYPVGPNEVTLYGEGVTADNLSICGPICGILTSVKEAGFKPSTVYVPVTITPFANAGTAATCSSGSPSISAAAVSGEKINGSNVFTITQNFSVSVPIEFGAVASIGDFYVQSGDSTAEKVIVSNGIEENIKADTDSPVIKTASDTITDQNNVTDEIDPLTFETDKTAGSPDNMLNETVQKKYAAETAETVDKKPVIESTSFFDTLKEI